jgi:hypothetical protein
MRPRPRQIWFSRGRLLSGRIGVVHLFGTWAVVVTAGDLTAARALADQLLDLAQREGSAPISELRTVLKYCRAVGAPTLTALKNTSYAERLSSSSHRVDFPG